MNAKELAEAVEQFLDSNDGYDSLSSVYPLIGDICREKAEHLLSNWQDRGQAHIWERFGKACDTAAEAFTKAELRIDWAYT